jgi:hypothetical protein
MMGRIVLSVEGGRAMYFLALLLTLRTQGSGSFSHAFEQTEVPAPLAFVAGQTEVPFHNKDTRVALLWHTHSRAHLRLACLNMTRGALKSAVQQAVAPASGLHYAGQACEVESVDLSNARWAGTASWADMVTGPSGKRVKLTFTTPLFTSPAGQAHNTLPFPGPLALFPAAQQQWEHLHGPRLPYSGEQAIALAKCMVTEYHLETVERIVSDRRFTGYLGWIEYTYLRQDEEAIAMLNALARFTFFTGNGYLTEQGMGVTTVSITN